MKPKQGKPKVKEVAKVAKVEDAKKVEGAKVDDAKKVEVAKEEKKE